MQTHYKILIANCIALLWFTFFIVGCNSNAGNDTVPRDRCDSGRIIVSADEAFKPVLDEQKKVYEAKYPKAKIDIQYKPEALCLQDMFNDSVRMVVATRKYTDAEKAYIIDSMHIDVKSLTIARDAIAVIINPAATDSLFTMEELKEILKGKFKKNLIPIFDGLNATSTIRFAIDSILRGDSLTAKAKAAETSKGVIDYIATHKDAIGFIGVSWIGNREDSAQISFLKKVKVAHIESTDKPGGYVLPVQANIYAGRYPMLRDWVYILKENRKGLGYCFGGFMSGEKGQLIFRRGYLLPTKMDFNIRFSRLKE